VSAPVSIDPARKAFLALGAGEAAEAAERGKLAELKIKQQRDQAERERHRAEKDDEDAIRLIDGENAIPRKPRRDGKLAKLDREAAAHTAAIRLQESRVQEAESAAARSQIPFIAAILDLSAEVQGDALDSARAALAGLAPHFARLIAADQIRAATIGESFPMPPGATPPFSGLAVIRAFIKEIPARLRTAELAEQALFAAAREISVEIIRTIKES
jgi:hypothetical protein